MIDQADARLRDWIKKQLGAVEVSFSPPKDGKGGAAGVGLYLLEIMPTPQPRGPHPPPIEVMLRYLVTTSADDAQEAHRMLGTLVFAALSVSDWQVEQERLAPETWAAFGIPPRPSFVLRLPVLKERPVPAVKLVRKPLVVRHAGLAGLHGAVLGPEDIPLAGARVELPAFGLSATTDRQGRFHFPTVPTEPRKKLVQVKARGRELAVTTDESTNETTPFLIRFTSMEG